MVAVTSTPACPRTPVVLLALEERGVAYTLRVEPEGWFERHRGASGPELATPEGTSLGLDAVGRAVVAMPTTSPENRDRWLARVAEVRPVVARLGAARRGGIPPAAADLAEIVRFSAELDAGLEETPWFDGDDLGPADVLLSFVAGLARAGVPLSPRVTAWHARLRARPSWARVVAAFPGAGR